MILIIKRGIDDFNPIDSRIQISFNLKDAYIQMSYTCKGPEHVQVNEPLDQLTLASYPTALNLPASKCEMAEKMFND